MPGRGDLVRLDQATGALWRRHFLLCVEEGPDRGRSHRIEDRTTVGSLPGVGFTLNDSTVSRHHLELVPRGTALLVRDLESRNGTYLGAVRIKEVLIDGAATLSVGKSTLRLEIAEEALGVPVPLPSFGRALGSAAPMRQLFGVLQRVSPTDSTVVLLGETGTGKDVLARSIHEASLRRGRPFVVVDCGAIAPALIESELFGHAKGAFTGAETDRDGAFLSADGGTLFLDEVGELSPDLQPKLLRFLETGALRRLGESVERRADVRVIAATHRDLEAEVRAGRFREDLFYRLAVVVVRVPPLRERLEDIPLLVRHLLELSGRPDLSVPRSVLEGWMGRPWTGNVRELRNAVERFVSLGRADLESFPVPLPSAPPEGAMPERERIMRTLADCGGNQTLAAKLLRISRRTLTSRLNAYALPRPRKGRQPK